MDFPGCSVVKNSPAMQKMHAGGMGSIPGSGRSPGERNGNPLQQSCLETSMNRRAQHATVHGVTKDSDMTQQLKNNNNKEYFNQYSNIAPTETCQCFLSCMFFQTGSFTSFFASYSPYFSFHYQLVVEVVVVFLAQCI